ncbi:MAG: starch-binding protein [Erysipelotrichaceae bacterium]|nr:starch-binding protein [Erysipelotrichaceae bacterium]
MKTRNYILFAILSLLSISSCGVTQDSSSAAPSSTSQEATTSATSSSSPSSSQRESSSSDVDSSSSEEYSSSDYSYSSSSEQSSSLEPSSSSEEQSSSEESSSLESSSSSEEQSSSEESSSSSQVIQKYTVTWLNDDDETLLVQDDYLLGETPSYSGGTPTKDPTAEIVYTFKCWEPEIVPITQDATYKATYSSAARKYTITWKDDDGTVLRTDSLEYGKTPDYGDIPTKSESERYSYSFSGWDPKVTNVTGDATYKAQYYKYDKTTKYTITWKNADGTVLETDSNVAYGTTPTYNGVTPTKASDSKYKYTFAGWTPGIDKVIDDAIYTATFTKELKPSTANLPDKLYFSSNKGWANVNAYAWATNTIRNADWPGVPMTYLKTNEYGEKVYEISGLSSYTSIIFNNGSEQTVDIAGTTIKADKNAFYLGDKNSDGKYTVGQWYESGKAEFATKGQNILHAFDWPIATILANLDAIKAQGFNAIQTSPLQPVKDYYESYEDTHETWWRFYQPVGLCLGNSTSNILFSTSDGASELTALCEAASEKGIRIIVDVIVNHLADGTGNGGLNPQVKQFSPEIYDNYTETLHNPNGKVPYDSSNVAGIVKSDAFGKDLNTANSKVQGSVYKFLKTLVDCGVTGFRFDAAKHIETKNDGGGCGSDFWEKTLGKVIDYASDTYKAKIWSYGEIISPGDAGRGYYQYINDAWFYAVTAQPGWYGLPAENCVSWGESHDDYMGEFHTTTDKGQDVINEWYKERAKSKDSNILYFVRPIPTALIKDGGVGDHPGWGWQNGQVKGANAR